jgi:abhydrolase domain-containing protein 5
MYYFVGLSIRPEGQYVELSDNSKRLWTLLLNPNASNSSTPLVMLHGMGAGVALWVLNLESLSHDRPVYAIDVLGFGRSSRIEFASDADQIEAEFVQSIEDWRQSMGLENMILLGHSMGAYLAASYTLKHAERVKHVVFVDPWGFQERPADMDDRPQSLWFRVVKKAVTHLNPFAALRLAGPWGKLSEHKETL